MAADTGTPGICVTVFLRPWKGGGRSFEHWRCTCCVNGRPAAHAAPPAGAACRGCPARGAVCPALRVRRKARCVQREARCVQRHAQGAVCPARGAARCVQRRRGRGPVAAGRGAPGICSEWLSPIRFQSRFNDRVIELVILCSWVSEVELHTLPSRARGCGRAGMEIPPGT